MTETKTPVVADVTIREEKSASKIIDLAVDPFVPNGWQITDHHKEVEDKYLGKKLSQISWGPLRAKLHLSESQKKMRSVPGHYLEHETKHLNVLNVNVLHFLEKNPQEIPESFWPTGDAVSQSNIFWGTRYKNSAGKRFVFCLLCFSNRTALTSYTPIDHGFSGSDPAVVWE